MYCIEAPAIKSGNTYYFNTESGIRYEVRFGRMKDMALQASIVFGVVNNPYSDEEYQLTNRGEVWQVMNTIVAIINTFRGEHPSIYSYEIYALEKEGESVDKSGARMNLYKRFIPRVFDEEWLIQIENNKATVIKKTSLQFYSLPSEAFAQSANTSNDFITQYKSIRNFSGLLKSVFGLKN
jgi:hypothetical protein